MVTEDEWDDLITCAYIIDVITDKLKFKKTNNKV